MMPIFRYILLCCLQFWLAYVVAQDCQNADNAFNLKSWHQGATILEELSALTTIYKSEKIQLKMTAVKGACYPPITAYIILLCPPDTKLERVRWKNRKKFASDMGTGEFQYIIEPFTIKEFGRLEIVVYPVNRITKSKRASPKKLELIVGKSKPIVAFPPYFYGPVNVQRTTRLSHWQDTNSNDNSNVHKSTWKCFVMTGQKCSVCTQESMDKLKDKYEVVFPMECAQVNNKYKLVIRIALEVDPSVFTEATQIVMFKPYEIKELSFTCIQNRKDADMLSLSTSLKTTFRGKCSTGYFGDCGKRSKDNTFGWQFTNAATGEKCVDGVDINYSKLTGLTKKRLSCKSDALYPGREYHLEFMIRKSAGSDDIKNSVIMIVKTLKEFKISNCDIMPKTGIAAATKFRIINCNYMPGSFEFEIYAVIGKKNSLLAKTNKVETQSFVLPAGAQVLLKYVSPDTGNIENLNFAVKVARTFNRDQPAAAIYAEAIQKLDDLADLAKKDPNGALQIVAAIEEEYSTVRNVSARNLDMKVLDTIKQISMTSPASAQQVANLLENIANRYSMSDPQISVQTAVLCAQAGKIMLKDARDAKTPEIMQQRMTNSMKSLSSCSQVGLKENPKSVAPNIINVSMPVTESALLPALGPKEDYPDYHDDEAASENMARFETASDIMETMCFSNAKMLIYTMEPDEPVLINKQLRMVMVSAKIDEDKKYVLSRSATPSVENPVQLSAQLSKISSGRERMMNSPFYTTHTIQGESKESRVVTYHKPIISGLAINILSVPPIVFCADTFFRSCDKAVSEYITSPEAIIKVSTACLWRNVPVVNIMMCTTFTNPYWYVDNIPLLTPVIYLQFNGTRDRSSTDLNLLGDDYFTIKIISNENYSKPSLETHEAKLPLYAITDLNEDNFHSEISTYRIYVRRRRGFTVQFINLTEGDKYDVTLLDFEKPSFKLFMQNRRIINVNNSVITIDTTHPYDGFWFLSVLPSKHIHEDLINNLQASTSYKFTVSSTGCYAWNKTMKFWEPSCDAKESMSNIISCECKFGSIFTGYRQNSKVTLEEEKKLVFKLKMSFCWIIYGTTLVTFVVFTFLLFITSFDADNEDILEKVFFVGDVPSFYEYAYLIFIKTGKHKHSGTTSNITIKLRGTEDHSLEHVLNYPDPDLEMLQRNTEFWFVVATHRGLGDITKLEIWFDSLGNNANWYCSKIEIFDLQTSAAWLFELENWFDVNKKGHHKFILTPVKRKLVVKESSKSARTVNAIKDVLGKLKTEVNLWNIIRAKDPLLSRKERVMLIFTSIFIMYVIIMFIYSVPKFDTSDTIDLNSFGFHINIVWTPLVASTSAFLIISPLLYILKRAKLPSNINKSECMKIRHAEWVLIILILMSSIMALVVCGFWIPKDTSLLWLTSSVLAILINWLFLQNLSRLFYIYCLKLPIPVQSFSKTIKRIIKYVELQRIYIYKRFGPLGLRPYLRHLYYKLDFISLKERIRWENTKIKIKEILDDLLMIILYVTMLYVILLLDKEPQAIYSHKEVKKIIEVQHMGNNAIKMKSLKSMEKYIVEILLPSVQSIHWYGKFIQENPGMTMDFSNNYLGVIRIRQHRTQEVPCKLPPEVKPLTRNNTCRPDFGVFIDRESYSKGWQPANEFINATSRMGGVWKYTNSSICGAPFYFGDYGNYPGGGYVAALGRNLKNSLINMKYLQKHKWFDLRTRAVFVEFLTYNPNVNLFNGVTVIFEHNSAGHIKSHFEVQTRKFLLIDKNKIFTFQLIAVLFFLAIAILVARVIYKIVTYRRAYFYDIWSTFDIIIVTLTGVSLYFFFARYGKLKIYITEVSEAKNNAFVNYFHLFASDDILTALTATLVFVATLRLWKLLRFMIIIKTAEKTLSLGWRSLLLCMMYQAVYMTAFSVVFVSFISSSSKDFRDYPTAFTSLVLLNMNLYKTFNVKQLYNHPLGVLFYITYMLFSILFMTVYIAMINIYYADARDLYADEESLVKKFVNQKWKYYKNLARVKMKKLRGGEDIEPEDDLIIKPKSGERYEKAMAVPRNRMDAMVFITLCVLTNREGIKTTKEEDFELMSKTIKALYGKCSKKDVFFTTGDSQHLKFVADRRLYQIADLCEKLVRATRDDVRVSRKIDQPLIQARLARISTLIENVNIIYNILKNIRVNAK